MLLVGHHVRPSPASLHANDERRPRRQIGHPMELDARKTRGNTVSQHVLQAACFGIGIDVRESVHGVGYSRRLAFFARLSDAVDDVAADGICERRDIGGRDRRSPVKAL